MECGVEGIGGVLAGDHQNVHLQEDRGPKTEPNTLEMVQPFQAVRKHRRLGRGHHE